MLQPTQLETRGIGAPRATRLAPTPPVLVVVLLIATGALLPRAAHGAGAMTVAAGHHHTCAITSDGALKCWGYNWSGQLGDGTVTYRASPVTVAGLTTGVVAVAAGNMHTCAVTSSGTVKCWGWNGYGQLGDGTTTSRTTPADVHGLPPGVKALAARGHHTCALTGEGAVWCWGWNDYGQLGDGTTTSRATPVQASGLTAGVLAIAGGYVHSCAITSAGGVKCWGSNDGGQLGDGTTARRTSPSDVIGLTSGVAVVTAGDFHTCAVTSGGGVQCWGWNSHGQLGDGSTTPRTEPAPVAGLLTGVVAASASGSHSCAVTRHGAVKCWGYNEWAQLGDGTTTDRAVPAGVSGLDSGFVAVTGGTAHSCALTNSGTVKCWGWTGWGELGDGVAPNRSTPTDVNGYASGALAVASGAHHPCTVSTAGGVRCWGYNSNGELGDGTTISRSTPVDAIGLGSGVVAVAGGNYHTCAVMSGGGVKCWGNNSLGQLGDGTWAGRVTAADVSGLASGTASVAAGGSHTCALTSNGGVKCWGDNSRGQLGDGTLTSRATAADVGGLTSGVTAVAAGAFHTCAATSAGGVRCWGANASGQLGDGTATDRSSPVAVNSLTGGVVALAAGESHTCAVTANGAVRCWGRNDWGQLGDGTTSDRSTPVQVVGLTSGVVALATGGFHTCAITNAGGAQCWGRNDWGQLGDGSETSRSAPAGVMGLTGGVAQVAGGAFHTCALTSGGGVTCWGADFYGQVGDGAAMVRTSPVVVQGFQYPSITSLAPVSALAGRGALALTVYGADFTAGATVLVGGTARQTSWVSAGELQAALSASDTATPGAALVSVQNPAPGGRSNGVAFVVLPAGSFRGNDFNGDGQPDIVWQHEDGWVALWIMNGVTQVQSLLLSDAPAAVGGWQIAGTGDFNGDGREDILWENSSGYVAAWIMNGTTQVSSQLLDDSPAAVDGWHVVAAGDMDGDGISDILWQRADGYVACWLMGVDWRGYVFQRSNALLDPRPLATGGWSIAGTGDLNGDGMTDVIWQNANGYVAAWLMNGLRQASSALLDASPAATDGWRIAGTADLNGNGTADLLWQKQPTSGTDTGSGWVATWFMNGTSHAGTSLLAPPRVTDPAWRIVGPK